MHHAFDIILHKNNEEVSIYRNDDDDDKKPYLRE